MNVRNVLPIAILAAALARVIPAAEPYLVKDINSTFTDPAGIQPPGVAVGGRAIFLHHDPKHGIEPWATDGTPEGTVFLADLATGPDSSTPSGYTALGGR